MLSTVGEKVSSDALAPSAEPVDAAEKPQPPVLLGKGASVEKLSKLDVGPSEVLQVAFMKGKSLVASVEKTPEQKASFISTLISTLCPVHWNSVFPNLVKAIQQDKIQGFKRTHKLLDSTLAACLLIVAVKLGNPKAFLKKFIQGMKMFPMHYTPQFDWKKQPMNKAVAVATWATGVYFLIKTYVLERGVVNQAHKKYAAHNNKLAVAAHGIGSSLEISIGCLACCYPERTIFTKASCLLAINNVISGFKLTPGVFGIKHLTVPGFYLFGILRCVEILRTLAFDYSNYPQAWILLQVGTVVRLLGFFVLPFSSTDGVRGDLFTEPSLYSFNILLSGYLVAPFVYPPKWVLSSLLFYVYWYNKQPPRISTRRRLHHDNLEDGHTKPAAIRDVEGVTSSQ